MLSCVEHEKSFLTSGSGAIFKHTSLEVCSCFINYTKFSLKQEFWEFKKQGIYIILFFCLFYFFYVFTHFHRGILNHSIEKQFSNFFMCKN